MAGKRWTAEELQILEQMIGTYTVATIAKKLGRSFDAVNIKLNRMGLSGFAKCTEYMTVYQLCLMFKVSGRTVNNKWRNKGLRISRRGNFKIVRQEDLIEYLEKHQEDWNAADVTDDCLIMSYPWYKEKKLADTKRKYQWTYDEVSKLNYLRHEGYSCREIAEKMGRTESSIKYKLYKDKNRKMG